MAGSPEARGGAPEPRDRLAPSVFKCAGRDEAPGQVVPPWCEGREVPAGSLGQLRGALIVTVPALQYSVGIAQESVVEGPYRSCRPGLIERSLPLLVDDGLEDCPESPCVSWRALSGRTPVPDSLVALRARAGYVIYEQRRGSPRLSPGDKEYLRVIG